MKKRWFFSLLLVVLFFSLGFQNTCPQYNLPAVEKIWEMVTICEESLMLPTEYCPSVKDVFFDYPEGVPTECCDIHFKKLDHPAWELYEEFGRPIYLVTALLPSLLIFEDVSWEDHKALIDRIIDENAGNALRAFGLGCWEGKWTSKLRFPYVKVGGKFDLDQYDETWKMETFRRIKYFVDRGGTFIYTLIDGCSMYSHLPGFWNDHPWNGDNNINGTCPDQKAVRHLYNWASRSIPGAKETKFYVLKFIEDMVRELEQRFPGAIVYDFNECSPTAEVYLGIDRDVFQKFDIPKHRKMCSPIHIDLGDYKYLELPLIAEKYIWQPHGVCNLEAYFNAHKPSSWLVHPSADGCTPVPYLAAKQIVMNSLFDGHCGFENNRFDDEGNVMDRVDWEGARGMKEAFLEWYNSQK